MAPAVCLPGEDPKASAAPSAIGVVCEDRSVETVVLGSPILIFRLSQPSYCTIKMLVFSLCSDQHLFEANSKEKQQIASGA